MPNAIPMDNYRGYRHPFMFGVHFWGGVGDNPRTLTELAMSQFSAGLRRNPEWWKQFQNQDVRHSWSTDARKRIWNVRTPSSSMEIQLSQKQIDYVLDELAGYASLRDEEHQWKVSCYERIWESDSVLDSVTAGELTQELNMLREQEPTSTRPGEPAITPLVDPMLYCLVYNRTLVSVPSRPSRPLPPPPCTDIYTVSTHFSVLPSDVSISPDGTSVKFLSYINNLHPDKHQSLYILLERCLAGFIPLFEHSLTDLHRNNPLMQRIPGFSRYIVWDEPDPPEHSDDEEGWITYEREMRSWCLNRPIQLPDVPNAGYPGGLERRRIDVSLGGKKVQVIVEISETRLTSEIPSLPSGPWHVEGMRNERIVACGYHFLTVENISQSSIQFRMPVTSPRGFTAGDTGATLRTWGLQDGDSCHQYIGSVPIRSGLSLVFPNIYQHRRSSIELDDPTKGGRLVMVAFYLVDPDIQPVVSTSMVSPQQRHWAEKALYDTLGSRLPAELIHKIMESVEGLMDQHEAESYREDLLIVRSAFRQANNNYHFCIPFDIWNGPAAH